MISFPPRLEMCLLFAMGLPLLPILAKLIKNILVRHIMTTKVGSSPIALPVHSLFRCPT